MFLFCWHNWGAWSRLIGAYSGVYQYKKCLKCSMIKHRRNGCNNEHNLSLWDGTDKKDYYDTMQKL